MEIISELHNLESKELLPQILLRIFTICKTDPHFPLKDQIQDIEGEVATLQRRLNRQSSLLEKTSVLEEKLKVRVDTLEQNNFELKSKLLEELGSEI